MPFEKQGWTLYFNLLHSMKSTNIATFFKRMRKAEKEVHGDLSKFVLVLNSKIIQHLVHVCMQLRTSN